MCISACPYGTPFHRSINYDRKHSFLINARPLQSVLCCQAKRKISILLIFLIKKKAAQLIKSTQINIKQRKEKKSSEKTSTSCACIKAQVQSQRKEKKKKSTST